MSGHLLIVVSASGLSPKSHPQHGDQRWLTARLGLETQTLTRLDRIRPNLHAPTLISPHFQVCKIEPVKCIHLFLVQSGEEFICKKKRLGFHLMEVYDHYSKSNRNRNRVVNFQSISERLFYGNGRAFRMAFFTLSIELEENKCYSASKLPGFNCLECFVFMT